LPIAHRAVEIIITLVLFGLVWLWLYANDRALMMDERDERSQRSRQAQAPIRPSPDPRTGARRAPRAVAPKTALPYQVASWIEHFFR
jgi:hypothetical protein